MKNQLWTLKETATHTGMSEAFWRKQAQRRAIQIVKIGRAVRVDPECVQRYLEARTLLAKGNDDAA